MENQQEIESLIYNLTGYPLRLIIASLLVLAITWFVSQNAKNIIPKLLFSITGFYLILSYPIMSVYTIVGIGLILPHIRIVSKYLYMQFLMIKNLSMNTYVFFLTIYYKALNLLKWITSVFKTIAIFFTTFDFKKAKNSYEKENPNEDFEGQYKQYYKQEEFYTKNKSNRYNQEKKKEQEYTYQQEETRDDDTSNSNEEENTENENYIFSHNTYGKEFEQFFSDDAYIILGINSIDDKKTIKKAFYKLAKKYHPDKHSDELIKYTDIFQRINNAYMKVGN